ncbi:SDR family NAD(P)-dependent oxidoreductase [Actinacidiphila paucisporea]|uniref:SDR family NAD(P)-dependent oxidoreductase n=1 Tax=Actinacidiphila paucisporea TaxID=310782 RepID=UPI0009A0B3B1|nr:SDR family oxidoreductase [Actinacidiphila paucisporea]
MDRRRRPGRRTPAHPSAFDPVKDGARVLIVGATGEIGGALARALSGRGAALALAGRHRERLDEVAADCEDCPTRTLDAYDLDACRRLPAWAAEHLTGIDLVLTAVGVAAFGPAEELTEAAAEHLVTVNALAPMAVIRGALNLLGPGGAAAAVTGLVAERPQAGMADYSAAKAALSAWLTAVAREQRRRRVTIHDLRPPHIDTGFADRALTGRPPALPQPVALDTAVRAIIDVIRTGGHLPPARCARPNREVP